MSIKNFFDKNLYRKSLSSASLSVLGTSVESDGYISEYLKQRDRFIPSNIDFSLPENFVFFGSAKKYYEDSIDRIVNTYPFDGSEKEKIEWYNSSSYLDTYIFEKEYPRTNGWANFSTYGWGTQASTSSNNFHNPSIVEYIQILGGPNAGPGGTRIGANIYSASYRESNLKFKTENGVTVEFWLKKDVMVSAKTPQEVIFDLWNGKTVTHAAGSEYGRFLIYLTASVDPNPVFKVTCVSGTNNNCTDQLLGAVDNSVGTSSVLNDTWNHFAISAKNSGNDLVLKLYLNGDLNKTTTVSSAALNEVTGSLIANIGSLRTKISIIDDSVLGGGKLSGSIDEFRYWTTDRTAEQIGRYYRSQIGGGTNTDPANVKLGIYYKFNEGITQTSSIDSKVLDYSGRISHGIWTGYHTGSRNTGSAIIDSLTEHFEFKDPIMYSFHSDVVDYRNGKVLTGSTYDYNNNSSIYYTMPQWIVDEDEKNGEGELLKLTQIVSSFFDETYLKIKEISNLKNTSYSTSSFSKPLTFANKLLEGAGFISPEIFVDASVLSQFLSRDEKKIFKDKIYNVKNSIYQNIYNNLNYIAKSKGTEKSFRNLIRCFGIDDEIIKINLYGDNVDYDFKNNYRYTSVRKKYVDFNDADRYSATVYQQTSSINANANKSYISGSHNYIPITVECEVLFPKKFSIDSELYQETPFVTCSLFGMHTATSSQSDFTWGSSSVGTDPANFQIFAIRDKTDSKDAYFILTGTSGGIVPLLTSSLYRNVYDNSKWNFAVRFREQKYPLTDRISNSTGTFYVEFYGVNTILNSVVNEFSVSGTISSGQGNYITGENKRLFIGAHRTNFTGSVLQRSDAKISSLRYWLNYLDNDTIKFHSYDVDNFGTLHPYRHSFLNQSVLTSSFIPELETLVLHWNFNNVTSSNSNGQFFVSDVSSGSLTLSGSRYGWFGDIAKNQYDGIGNFFLENDIQSVDREYVHSAKQRLPELLDSSDTVEILNQDDEIFVRDSRPIKHFISFEKNMYQTISEEMLNLFASIKDFNNLIGKPVNRYRKKYKGLEKIRQLFYERVRNIPDLEKYIDFYKWIDESISIMLQKLIPASANTSEEIRTVIESHIFERNKYETKYPTLEFPIGDLETGIKGINELLYDWKSGSAPTNLDPSSGNELWWSKRAERNKSPLTVGNGVDNDRQSILTASLQVFNRSFTTPLHLTMSKSIPYSASITPISITNYKRDGGWDYILEYNGWGVNTWGSFSWGDEDNLAILPITGNVANYQKDYQIVQTSGRRINNRALVISSSYFDFTNYIPNLFLSGTINNLTSPSNTKIQRGKHEHIFVERFSAPGSKETSGDGNGGFGLDRESAEFSVYNSMNFRNLVVKKDLQDKFKNHMGQFGVESSASVRDEDYNTEASFHKVSRNPLLRIKLSGSGPVTSSFYDNWFMQHTLPQQDRAYLWITASAINLPVGFATSSEEINFVSRSLNDNTINFSGFNSSSYASSSNPTPTEFNSLILNRQGPYAWPSWKQLRVGESQLARNQKKNNIIEILEPSDERLFSPTDQRIFAREIRGTKVSKYNETPVTVKNKPIIHTVSDIENKDEKITVKYTHANNLSFFGNTDITNKLGLTKDDKQIYDKLFKDYTNTEINFEELKYSEIVFPTDENVFLNEIRERETYGNVFWHSDREKRNAILTSSQGYNSTFSKWPLDARNNYTAVAGQTSSAGYYGELQNNTTIFFRPAGVFGDFASNLKVGPVFARPTLIFPSTPSYSGSTYGPGEFTSSTLVAGDTFWSAGQESGLNPEYNTYRDYSNDIRYKGKEFSIVPEFRISELMEKYIDEHGGNFLADIPEFLNLTGATYQDSSTGSFFKTYSHSDFMKYFQVIKTDHEGIAKETELTIKCNAILKLLPYSGFYPAIRTLQLAELFSSSYSDNVEVAGYTSSVTSSNGPHFRSFLTPFFAPGIVYNSIKSGIAVDFPIYAGDHTSSIPGRYESINWGSKTFDNSLERTSVLSGAFTKRIPFEALVEPETYLSNTKIWDMESDRSGSLWHNFFVTSSNQASLWSGKGSQKYKLAMHNFLSETADFFLEDGNFTTFVSDKIPKDGISILPEEANNFFGMDIYVSNSKTKNLTEWLSRYNSSFYSQSVDPVVPGITTSSMKEFVGMHTVMYDRQDAFGPPWIHDSQMFTSGSTNTGISKYAFRHGYESFTPAYYDGFGQIRLLFFPFKGAGKYTLDEIQSNLTASFIRVPTMRTGSAAVNNLTTMLEYQVVNAMDQNILDINFTSTGNTGFNGFQYASQVYSASLNWQQLGSSINYLGKTKVKKVIREKGVGENFNISSIEDNFDSDDLWIIQPKWETPIFNFSSSIPIQPFDDGGGKAISKGIWHQYANPITDNANIVLGISDIPNTHLSCSWFATSSNQIINYRKRESIVDLKKDNAKIDLYVINPYAAGEIIINFITDNVASNAVIAPTSYGGFSNYNFDLSPSCQQTAENISNMINASTSLRRYLTASVFKPDFETSNLIRSQMLYKYSGSIADVGGILTGGIDPYGIHIQVSHGIWADRNTDNFLYWPAGNQGNNIKFNITGSFPYTVTIPGTMSWTVSSPDELYILGVKDEKDNTIFKTTANMYGGLDRTYEIKSLADKFGFEKVEKKLGKLPFEKIISEAIVAIPFIEKQGVKNFIKIDRELIDVALGNVKNNKEVGESIKNMVDLMKKYIIPPKMDFIKYKQIEPFAMYIFEFSTRLDKEDVGRIWQNLPPKIANNFEQKSIEITHKLNNNELIFDLNDDIRWMVFKVKKKGKQNYFEKTADSKDDVRFKFDFQIGSKSTGKKIAPDFSYNFPYDYFSLIELIGLETDVLFGKNKQT